MNYLLERKKYDRKKSDAEDVLMNMIKSGRVKVGSDEWRKRCEYIEAMNEMASRFQTAYDENI